MSHTIKRTIDLAGLIAAIMMLTSAIWWAADSNARLKNVEDAVQPIQKMQQDVAVIKEILSTKQVSQQ